MSIKIRPLFSPLVLGIGLILSLLALLILVPALPVSGAPAMTGAIAGRVHDSTGAPLPYAGVWAEPVGASGGGNGTQADASGYYTITELAAGDYRVGADKPGYVTKFYNDALDWDKAAPVQVADGATTGDIDFILEVGGAISGRVYNHDGFPLAQADVWAESMGGQGHGGGAMTDASGYYTLTELAAGEYRVGANKDGYSTKYYSDTFDWGAATPLLVTGGMTTTGIDFSLDMAGIITGTVMNESGTIPIVKASVHANANSTGGASYGMGTEEIDSSGAYTISGLLPGQYKVEARAPGYDQEFYRDQIDWMLADVVTVTAGEATPNINFTLAQEAGGAIFGQVVLPNGDPVPQAWVQAESFDYLVHKGEGTDENGNFRVGGLVTGTWRLRAHPPGASSVSTYNDYSESAEILVTLSSLSPLTLSTPITLSTVNVVGRVVMPDGSAVAWTGVDVHNPDFSIHRGSGTDHEGRFGLGGLPLGDYQLELQVPWGTAGVVPPPPRSFSITDTGVIVDLGDVAFAQATKHIIGQVVRADSGQGVSNAEVNASRRGADGWAWTQTDGSGHFSMDVSPGDWEVMLHPSPDGSADWVYNGFPKMVSFANDDSEETIDITLTVDTADARVIGRVEGPNGEQLAPWTAWIDIRNNDGHGNGTSVAPNGRFDIAVTAGTYHVWLGVDERTYPDWSSPAIPLFNVAGGETKDLGTIRLVEKTSAIEGRVTRSGDGAGMAGIMVHAWQFEGGWASTTTGVDGNYRLSVLAGIWEVDVEAPYTSTYVTGQPPQQVTVADNQTIGGIDFALEEAAGIIEGTLYDPQGNPLTDIDGGWAYARQGNNPEPIAGAPVNNGQFTLNVPSGSYMVGIWLPPNMNYTVAGEQQVGPLAKKTAVAKAKTRAEVAAVDMSTGEYRAAVQAGGTVSVAFTLLPNDARIVGTFYTDDDKTIPATNLLGEVFAMGGMGGAWQSVSIDPTTASFEMDVAAGEWNLGYWLQSTGYVNSPPPDTRLTIESGEVFTFNFTIVAADATVEGFIQKPDGSPLNHAWGWAHRERSAGSAAIDSGDDSRPPDGYFSISIPSGGQYEVGAYAPEDWGYIQPDFQIVTPTAGSAVSVTLQFRDSNATITGTVFYHDQAGNEVYGPWAWVWAWSDDGQHAGAPTDFNGQYQLNVVTGTTWHIGAAYQAEEGSFFYETTSPTEVVMDTPQAWVDLELELASTALPSAVANTFDPSLGWTSTLSDGTHIEIPAGAMPTTDTVRISVTPLVEELHNTLTARPFGFGYGITAYENSTGNQIASNFNANVLITFYYTDDELARRGVTEDNLSPAYFSTTTNSWTKVESYSVDKDANRITVQVNHFSTWALTSSGSAKSAATSTVYLPLLLK